MQLRPSPRRWLTSRRAVLRGAVWGGAGVVGDAGWLQGGLAGGGIRPGMTPAGSRAGMAGGAGGGGLRGGGGALRGETPGGAGGGGGGGPGGWVAHFWDCLWWMVPWSQVVTVRGSAWPADRIPAGNTRWGVVVQVR